MASDSAAVPLLATLLVVSILGLSITAALYIIRRRKNTKPILPTHITVLPYTDSNAEKATATVSTTNTSIPEIRITFPEEETADGKRKSGRVVIVQVGEAGAAFVREVVEPTTISESVNGAEKTTNDGLPPYNMPASREFDSVDLDRVGGLKEKHNWV